MIPLNYEKVERNGSFLVVGWPADHFSEVFSLQISQENFSEHLQQGKSVLSGMVLKFLNKPPFYAGQPAIGSGAIINLFLVENSTTLQRGTKTVPKRGP